MHGRTRFLSSLLLIAGSLFFQGTQAALQAQAHVDAREDLFPSSSTSTSPTPTSSTSSSATTATVFFFNNTPQPTTCGSSTITWMYMGPGASLDLQVTNVGVDQIAAPPIPSTTRNIETSIVGRAIPTTPIIPISTSDITMTIGTNLTASSRTFVWTSVNVPQGWYSLSASIFPVQELFYVRTGTNTSCLVVIPSGTGTTTITPVSTPASIASQSQSTTSSQASPPAAVVSDVVNVGIIVGVSLGVAALFIAVVAGWLCYRKKKSRTISGKSGNLVHRWNGLSSTDSRVGFAAKPTNTFRSHHLSNPDSVAYTLGTDFEDDGIGAEKNKVSALFDEQGVALSTLPVLHHQSERPRPTRTYSGSSSTSNVFNDQGALPVRGSAHGRPSIDSSLAYPPSSPLSQTLRDSAQYMVAPVMSNSHSRSTTGTQHSSSNHRQTSSNPSSIPPSQPLPPPPSLSDKEIKQMHRNSLGRKRKPVPAYDAGEDPATFAPPMPFYTPTTSTDSADVPELAHKSSFGPGGVEGKPLHYLIPDMPMPKKL